MVLALVGLLSAPVISRAGAATQSTSAVTFMSDPTANPPPGSSTLTRTGSGIALDLHTTGLQAGRAVTIWWMVFNHPEACLTGATTPTVDDPRCGMADMDNPAAGLSVLYAAGHVIDEGGVADFGGYLAEHDGDGAIMGQGLEDAAAADIPPGGPRPRARRPAHGRRADHTFGACNPPGLENCHDLQMSIHQVN